MNFISTIIKDTESFAHAAEKDLKKLWGEAPKFDDIALTGLTYVGPILEEVFTLETGATGGALVTAIITKAEQELTAAKGLITKIGPTPSVANLITGVGADLSNLLTAANITNPKSVANVKLVVQELSALVESFPTPAPVAPAASTAATGAQTAAPATGSVVSLT